MFLESLTRRLLIGLDKLICSLNKSIQLEFSLFQLVIATRWNKIYGKCSIFNHSIHAFTSFLTLKGRYPNLGKHNLNIGRHFPIRTSIIYKLDIQLFCTYYSIVLYIRYSIVFFILL